MSKPCPLRERMAPMPGVDEMEVESFQETASDFLAEAQLDRESHIVRNVALLGPESRNGYRYTSEAMQNAAALYDGRPVFVDHAHSPLSMVHGPSQTEQTGHGRLTMDHGPLQRSLRDYAGKVVNPRFENQRVRGDLHLIGPNAEWLLSLFEAAPSDIGMSHVVLARRNPAGDEVAKIEKVVSVDIVAFPATVQSFREEVHGPSSMVHGQERQPAMDHGRLTMDQTETPRSVERESSVQPVAIRRALITAIRGE